MVHWNLPWIGGAKQRATGGVFKVNCIKRLLVIHSSDPELRLLDPMPGREARVLDNETLTTHNDRTHCSRGGIAIHDFPNRGNQKPFRDDFPVDETVNYNCTGTQMDVSGATQLVNGEWQTLCLECLDRIEIAILSEESDEILRRYEESQRRDAAGVPLEPIPGRVDDSPPSAVAGATVIGGAAKNRDCDGGTSLREHRFTHENWGWEKTTEVTESDRQAKRCKTIVSELVNELMHLGATIGPRLRDGCQNWKIGKSWKKSGRERQ